MLARALGRVAVVLWLIALFAFVAGERKPRSAACPPDCCDPHAPAKLDEGRARWCADTCECWGTPLPVGRE